MMIVFMVCGCSKKDDTAVSEPVVDTVKDPLEVYYGIWKVDKLKVNDSFYSVEELEYMGDYSASDIYIVIKEGGSVYFAELRNDDSYGGSWEFNEDNNSVSIEGAEFMLDEDAYLYAEIDGDYMYLKRYSYSQSITDIPKLEDNTVSEEPVIEDNSNNNVRTGMSDEFMKAMDSYENFIDEYCTFMKKYYDNPNDLSILADYGKFMINLDRYERDFADWESSDMTDEEADYYYKVQLRCNAKLLETLSEMN